MYVLYIGCNHMYVTRLGLHDQRGVVELQAVLFWYKGLDLAGVQMLVDIVDNELFHILNGFVSVGSHMWETDHIRQLYQLP